MSHVVITDAHLYDFIHLAHELEDSNCSATFWCLYRRTDAGLISLVSDLSVELVLHSSPYCCNF